MPSDRIAGPAPFESAREPDRLRIMFVCLHDFSAPTEKQILGFGMELARRGHDVRISLAGDATTAVSEGAFGVPRLEVAEHRFRGPRLRPQDEQGARIFAPTLIHASLSRLPVAAAARRFGAITGAPVFVHFGDDEWAGPPSIPGDTRLREVGRVGRRLGAELQPSLWQYSTRRSLAWVQRRATGLDALTPALAQEVERQLGRPCATVLPVMPSVGPDGSREAARRLPAGVPTVLFTGSILPEYGDDVLLGMRAVAEVQRRGRKVHFVQAGKVHPRVDPGRLAGTAGLRPGSAHFLGYVPFLEVAPLLARASVLVQPGGPSRFNRLRLPAKLQAYLASGTPTVTFAVGVGELLEDRVEVLKTHTAQPAELVDRIVEALEDRELRRRLSEGGPRAARRLFDPASNTEALLAHYRERLAL